MYPSNANMASDLFVDVAAFIKKTQGTEREKRQTAIDEFLDTLRAAGRGVEILRAAYIAAWKQTTSEDRATFHECKEFIKTGECEHTEKSHWVEGCCENCGYYTCSSYCLEDHEYWSNPSREMYMCEDCGSYTCEMEKKEHVKMCCH